MSDTAKLRVDVWLWRARFVKTRAAASRWVSEGGVRQLREGASKRLDKPAALVAAGDVLVFADKGAIRAVRVLALGSRRGPPAEARALYADIAADAQSDLASLA